jgi:glutamine amidotransferase
MFMHNGGLGGYREVMRRLREELEDDLYFGIRGSTDSEHAFAVIQERLGADACDPDTADLAEAVRDGLEYLETIKHEVGRGEATTWANFCLTDGESVVATRYASPEDVPAESLYVGEAGSFVADGEFTGTPEPEGDAATLVASEALFEDERVWREVPGNSMVTVAPDGETAIEPLNLDVPTA